MKRCVQLIIVGCVAWAASLGATVVQAEPFPAESLRDLDARTIRLINRVIVLTQVSGIYDDLGQSQQAERCISEAIKWAEAAPPGRIRDWLRNKTANKLAHSYSAVGLDVSLKQFPRAVEYAQTITELDLLAHAYAKLGEKRFKSGDEKHGVVLLDRALETAQRIEPPAMKAAAYASIGKEFANCGRKAEAKKLLNEGLTVASQCPAASDRVALATELAGNLIIAEDEATALKVLEKVVAEAAVGGPGTGDALYDREKPNVLIHIADTYSALGRKQEASDLLATSLKQTLAMAPSGAVPDQFYEHHYRLQPKASRAKLLAETAGAYANLEAWPEAESVIGQIQDVRYRGMALAKLAFAQQRSGLKDEAQQSIRKATELKQATDDPLKRMEILMQVAKAQVKLKADEKQVADLLVELEKQLPQVD